MYSKGICSQSKLTPRKPKHRNPIVSHDLCSLSRLYWVLQIPGLPSKAIKILALLGVTKALAMKTCMLHSRWVCSLAAWNNGTKRGVNFPHLTHLGALVHEGPSLNWKSYFQTMSLSSTQTASLKNVCQALSQPGKKNPFPHQPARKKLGKFS